MTENEQLEMIGIINRIKAEAYKEFAERLKGMRDFHYDYSANISLRYITIENIDNLLKELVGEGE